MIPGKRMPPKLANKIKRLQLVVPDEQHTKINEWRIHQPGIPNVSQAIRMLIDIGLAASDKPKPPKPKKPKG
jgi:hypothetical protein